VTSDEVAIRTGAPSDVAPLPEQLSMVGPYDDYRRFPAPVALQIFEEPLQLLVAFDGARSE